MLLNYDSRRIEENGICPERRCAIEIMEYIGLSPKGEKWYETEDAITSMIISAVKKYTENTEENQMNRTNQKLYIAYGSNLNLGQMKHRCPTAKILGTAVLRNYELLFRGNHGNAAATVQRCKGGKVPVLLWALQDRDEGALDIYEGFPRLYRKETVRITFRGKQIRVMMYVMNEVYPYGRPNKEYFNTILKGYQTAGFDAKILREAVQNSIMKGREKHDFRD
jgi:gamma-glutamylcyclotransferase (GGCT)/AIG2-like uncharacterized protein YtfP